MPDDLLSREIFGNVDAVSKIVFYILTTAALISFGVGVWKHARRWRRGRASSTAGTPIASDWGGVVRRIFSQVLSQATLHRSRPVAGGMHTLMFWGFGVLFIGTILVSIEHYAATFLGRPHTDPVFHKGIYYAVFELTLDLFGLAFLIGVGWFAIRRARGSSSMAHRPSDWIVIGTLIGLGITGYLTEGLRIVLEGTPMPGLSPVGYVCALGFGAAGVDETSVGIVHRTLWWIHTVLALGLVAAFPHCRLMHAIAGALRLAAEPKKLGVMTPVSIEQVEETGIVGVENLEHLSRLQLVELDACVSCGRCEDACPAFSAGKPLSPREVVQDLRTQLDGWTVAANGNYGDANGGDGEKSGTSPLPGQVVSEETLWSCTACTACESLCPLGVRPLTLITDMRRFLVGEGRLRGAPSAALAKMQRSGNPWGLPAEDRLAWAKGLNVKTVADGEDFDVLYWVGCAASYDKRTQRVARAVVRLLQTAGVSFAVLGKEERCTGESARRMGDEFVFQELAGTNIETFERHGVKQIVTHCPHCLNSLRQDYPQFGGHFEVVHHSQFLADLIEAGRLPITAAVGRRVTIHDPCYLARVNEISEPPRRVLTHALTGGSGGNGSPGELLEMARCGRDTACCGAGGGRMWFDDAPTNRVGGDRFDEVAATGAETVAVACPFCLTMMSDFVGDRGSDLEVRDIAELLVDALEPSED